MHARVNERAAPDRRTAGAAPAAAGGGILRPVLIAWAIANVIFLLIEAKNIAVLRFSDPDDAMRLLEVRDWIAGQSWWDVAQHRFNHGQFPMHWSRLVDLPLAAVMITLTPLVGEPIATRVAMTLVPMLILLATMLLLAQITRRTAGLEAARYAALLTPLTMPVVAQMRPLRIDHHGWQIVLALAAVACLTQRPTARMGAVAGLALAALLTISLEGLPIAACIAGVAAAACTWEQERRPFFLSLMWSLAGGALTLHLVTRGPGFFLPACDAISPAWLVTLVSAAVAATVAVLLPLRTLLTRLAALAGAGAITGAVLLAYAPECLAGPFATLPPLAYQLWYLNVLEGQPLWSQTFHQAFVTMALPVVGLIATGAGWRRADAARRLRWAMLVILLAAATMLTVFVNRAAGTANALAIPGTAAMLLALLIRVRTIPNVAMRTAATAAALIVASPGYLAVATFAWERHRDSEWQARTQAVDAGMLCDESSDIRALAALPPALIFAPLDVGPELLATTRHRAIGSGYHRAAGAITTVTHAFTAAPREARQTILASGAAYLAACPGLGETDLYEKRFPNGLWARLARGERFDWLKPVALRGPARAWRIIRPLPSPMPRP